MGIFGILDATPKGRNERLVPTTRWPTGRGHITCMERAARSKPMAAITLPAAVALRTVHKRNNDWQCCFGLPAHVCFGLKSKHPILDGSHRVAVMT